MQHTDSIEKNIEYLPAIYLTDSIKALYQQGKKIASSDHAALLISGEQGTGKELLAKSIHYALSPNAQFLTVNCVNLPFKHLEEKIETCFAILRGNSAQEGEHSISKRPTLFLRNISKLENAVQKSLADLLRERIIEYAGTDPARIGSIRLIFSAHHTAEQGHQNVDKVVLKTFNPQLINILPLRDRKKDIYPLALFFVDKFSKEYGKDIGGIHTSAVQMLEEYPWTGNVSELRDVIENAVILAQPPLITKEDIRFNVSKKSIVLESFLAREDFFTLEELERIYIQTVFRRVKNNKSKAAKILGISRNTLQKKIELFAASHAKNHKKEKKRKTGSQPSLF